MYIYMQDSALQVMSAYSHYWQTYALPAMRFWKFQQKVNAYFCTRGISQQLMPTNFLPFILIAVRNAKTKYNLAFRVAITIYNLKQSYFILRVSAILY